MQLASYEFMKKQQTLTLLWDISSDPCLNFEVTATAQQYYATAEQQHTDNQCTRRIRAHLLATGAGLSKSFYTALLSGAHHSNLRELSTL